MSPESRAYRLLLYSRLRRTFTSPTLGNGIPTQNTALAKSSLKSSPSLTLPRYTASIKAPPPSLASTAPRNSSSVAAKVCAPGSSASTVPTTRSSSANAPLRSQSSMTRRISAYLGKNTSDPVPRGTALRYLSSSRASCAGIFGLSCVLAVKSPRASRASTWICRLGTTCGASTLTGNLTPSSPSRLPMGERVPLVTMTHIASSDVGPNATEGRRHHIATPAPRPREFESDPPNLRLANPYESVSPGWSRSGTAYST
mmetsp:Transcript_6210/g.25218  ORF Transcript_6210/g.25218 Transcript_6210/m.25218 type:complete len:257 (-) Transcript_6210:452-1222(-)